jgi:hypothetical protein
VLDFLGSPNHGFSKLGKNSISNPKTHNSFQIKPNRLASLACLTLFDFLSFLGRLPGCPGSPGKFDPFIFDSFHIEPTHSEARANNCNHISTALSVRIPPGTLVHSCTSCLEQPRSVSIYPALHVAALCAMCIPVCAHAPFMPFVS